ncbi:large-conductance mechanosensitive channel protein MscL [Pontibacter silvestris]|uniref:Large-conductance mechanosensitive channel n=1 Tax=Pontibacter silvestris TaxID=2305183 RepID=A0ABW4WW42_9BACT|nr:large-conductance mechanosensitive channel protein MscL [Pontibacter silvestris]MCC9136351.1 large-conductance mechanosensitive channel protein MscL [Pontibacter silvestris]
MSFLSEFKKFAVKGNVIDLAVGVVIGTAFGGITTSLVNDILMPPLGLLISGIDFINLQLILKEAVVENGEVVTEAVTINYGTFLQKVINFFLIAFAIFLMVRTINRLKHEEAVKEAAKPALPVNKQEVLLGEIRDILLSQSPEKPTSTGPSV